MRHKQQVEELEQVPFNRDCASCYMGPCEVVGICGAIIPASETVVAAHRDRSYLSKRLWVKRPHEQVRAGQRHTKLGSSGRYWTGLNKRTYPNGICELCSIKVDRMHYHHWDDDNPSLGLWLCPNCHRYAEGMDQVLNDPSMLDQYANLKATVSRIYHESRLL